MGNKMFGIFYLISLVLIVRCSSSQADVIPELIMFNVSYGSDPQQIMDIYLPRGRNTTASKVFILIHEGDWYTGSKDLMGYDVQFLREAFSQHAIVNMEYRLGTISSPGYPKQIKDIGNVIQHMIDNKDTYNISSEFGLVGAKTGGHLALLYGYGFDTNHDVKVVCNMFGPSNMTHPVYEQFIQPLIGNITYDQNPKLYEEVSPIYYVTSESPKTIGFYGALDLVEPSYHVADLYQTLINASVYNELYIYPGVGYGNWTYEQSNDSINKTIDFFRNYF